MKNWFDSRLVGALVGLLAAPAYAGVAKEGNACLDVVDVATGLADFAGTSITLNNASNTYGTLRFNSAGAVVIAENDGTNLSGTNTAASLDLDSAGAIADDSGATLVI